MFSVFSDWEVNWALANVPDRGWGADFLSFTDIRHSSLS